MTEKLPDVKSRSTCSDDCRGMSSCKRHPAVRMRQRVAMMDSNGSWGLPQNHFMKELTYRILYEFSPVALSILVPQHLDQPSVDQTRAVKAAALSLAVMCGLPVVFIEYMLCVPWISISNGYIIPQQHWHGDNSSVGTEQTAEEKQNILNTPLHVDLMEAFLDFLFAQEQHWGLPAIFQQCQPEPQPQDGSQMFLQQNTPHRESVAALLDGATPLHFAALRGSDVHCRFLCQLGADPHVRTAAGELAMELVPVCGDGHPCACAFQSTEVQNGHSDETAKAKGRSSRRRSINGPDSQSPCDAAGPRAEARRSATKMNVLSKTPESGTQLNVCMSKDARAYLAGKMVTTASGGLCNILSVLFSGILCVLGFWGQHTTLMRPTIEHHVCAREEERREKARRQAQELMSQMRSSMASGCHHFLLAKRLHANAKQMNVDQDQALQEPANSVECCRESDLAVQNFTKAVHACQSLGLKGGTLPQGFVEALPPAGGGAIGPWSARVGFTQPERIQVSEDEQAEVYSGWVLSLLLKFRACACPTCVSIAVQAMRMAHSHVGRLFRKVERKKRRAIEKWRAVGCRLVEVVYARCCLLLETEARKSANGDSILEAEQCLKDWDALVSVGLTNVPSVIPNTENGLSVIHLREWVATSRADLKLAMALLGRQATEFNLQSNITVHDMLFRAINREGGKPVLRRPVSRELVGELEAALSNANLASTWVKSIATEAINYAASEILAAENLLEIMSTRNTDMAPSQAVEMLTKAIDVASEFKNLNTEVANARSLRERCRQQAKAVSVLDAAASKAKLPKGEAEGELDKELSEKDLWARRFDALQVAIKDAQEASVNVGKAKKLLRELKACSAAAEAIERLDKTLLEATAISKGGRPPGSGALKSVMSLADEVAATLAAASGTDGSIAESATLMEILKQRMAQGRCQMGKKKALENLARTLASTRGVADLPKLESAILAARKVGAEETDRTTYAAASDMRTRLAEAARVKSALAEKLRGLVSRGSQRANDADECVIAAIAEAEGCCAPELLEVEIRDAREQLERWRAAGAAEVRLSRALQDGNSMSALRRAIQEASAVGVKVGEAKRVLKAMQALESSLSSDSDAQLGGLAAVRTKVQAAVAAGIKGPWIAGAKARLGCLLGKEAKDALDAALKPRGEIARSADERCSALQSALFHSVDLMEQHRSLLTDASELLKTQLPAADGNSFGNQAEDAESGHAGAGSGVSVARLELERSQAQADRTEKLMEFVRGALTEAQREREIAETERAEVERLRKEKAERERSEKEKRDRERKEKSEAERQAREKADRERKERGRAVAEAADRQRRIRQQKERQAERQQEKKYAHQAQAKQHTQQQAQATAQRAKALSHPFVAQRHAEDLASTATNNGLGSSWDLGVDASLGQLVPAVPITGWTPLSQGVTADNCKRTQDLRLPEHLMSGLGNFGYQQESLIQFSRQQQEDCSEISAPEMVDTRLEKTESFGQLEILANSMLDTLNDPEWTVVKTPEDAVQDQRGQHLASDLVRNVIAPLSTEHGDLVGTLEQGAVLPSNSRCAITGSAKTTRAFPSLVPTPPNPNHTETLQSLYKKEQHTVNYDHQQDLNSNDDRLLLPMTGPIGHSVGGLPLAGMGYGGSGMWGIAGDGLNSHSNDVSAFSGISNLLPTDLGLGGVTATVTDLGLGGVTATVTNGGPNSSLWDDTETGMPARASHSGQAGDGHSEGSLWGLQHHAGIGRRSIDQ